MSLDIRPVTDDDHERLRDLLTEAFGVTDEPRDLSERPDRFRWLAWVDGDAAASIEFRFYSSWFRGVEVKTAGVTGVSIASEHRGDGLLRPMMEELLRYADEQGDKIASLFPTATGIYRGFGFARVLQVGSVQLPTMSLARLEPTLASRRATSADDDLLHDLYERWAKRHDGPLTRKSGGWESDSLWEKEVTSTTIFEGDDGPSGYLRFKRGPQSAWGEAALEVPELIALDAETGRTALASLASYEPVAASVKLFSPGDVDPLRWLLPANAWRPLGDREPYMLRVLDPTSLSALPAPEGVTARLPFRLAGPSEEGWVLHVKDGRIDVERDDSAAGRTVELGALGASFAGSLPSRIQRSVGLIEGGEADDDLWDVVFTSGRFPAIRDAF